MITGQKGGAVMTDLNRPVLINLLATARYDQTPEYPIQFMTRGNLSLFPNGKAVISYTESLHDDESGETMTAQVSLEMTKSRVTMTRHGDVTNTMVFVPRQRYEGVYQTPYGDMNMGVFARDVNCMIGPEKGSLHLKYQIDFQGTYASTNELHLEYTTEKKGRAQ